MLWKMDDHPVPIIIIKMDVLPKTFVQVILAAKWLVRHSSMSPKQQRRPLPSWRPCYFQVELKLLALYQEAGRAGTRPPRPIIDRRIQVRHSTICVINYIVLSQYKFIKRRPLVREKMCLHSTVQSTVHTYQQKRIICRESGCAMDLYFYWYMFTTIQYCKMPVLRFLNRYVYKKEFFWIGEKRLNRKCVTHSNFVHKNILLYFRAMVIFLKMFQ